MVLPDEEGKVISTTFPSFFAIQCRYCGRWQGVRTSQIVKFTLKCKKCYKYQCMRSKGYWNNNIKGPIYSERELKDIISELNTL
jgi:hypothetical protein